MNFLLRKSRRIGSSLLLAFVSLCGIANLQAQITIKLATLTPDNTPWNDALYAGIERIEKLVNGRVRVRVYGNGLAGDESEVLRKMRLGSVDAGIFTAIALKSVVPETLVFSLPYFIKTQEDLEKVMQELVPDFNKSFAKNGYKVLGWAFSGWVYMFYKDDIRTPDQVNNVRLGISPSEPELQAAWQSLGFRVSTVSFSDTFVSLQNGLLTGFYSTPIGALAYQWFAFAPHMVYSKVAPLLGGVLISTRIWNRISSADQAVIQQEMDKMIRDFSGVAQEQDAKALEVMEENGLKVYMPSESEEQAWQDAFNSKGYPQVIGPHHTISNDLYQRAQQIIQAR